MYNLIIANIIPKIYDKPQEKILLPTSFVFPKVNWLSQLLALELFNPLIILVIKN
jgi:hypothetical protein